MDKEKLLGELIRKLSAAAGENLVSIALFGSAAGGEFHEKYSDVNVLCVVTNAGVAELEQLSPSVAWWAKKGHPTPLIFSREELKGAVEVFPIEFLDIKARRRVLFGEDVFATLDVPLRLYRAAIERELDTNLVRLRQAFLAGNLDGRRLMRLMTSSLSSFATLFRHALSAFGESAPLRAREVIDRLAARFELDAGSLHTLWDIREGKRDEKATPARALLSAYLECLQRAIAGIHRGLAESDRGAQRNA